MACVSFPTNIRSFQTVSKLSRCGILAKYNWLQTLVSWTFRKYFVLFRFFSPITPIWLYWFNYIVKQKSKAVIFWASRRSVGFLSLIKPGYRYHVLPLLETAPFFLSVGSCYGISPVQVRFFLDYGNDQAASYRNPRERLVEPLPSDICRFFFSLKDYCSLTVNQVLEQCEIAHARNLNGSLANINARKLGWCALITRLFPHLETSHCLWEMYHCWLEQVKSCFIYESRRLLLIHFWSLYQKGGKQTCLSARALQ